MHPYVRRAAVLTATTTLALSALALPAHAAPRSPEGLGARWLERQLTDGLMHNDQYDIDDYGLSIDTALAFDAIGGHRPSVREISDAMAPQVDQYISDEAFDPGSTYAGATAKALVLAQVAGDDPTAYGGVDLVDRLEGVVSTADPIRGRIADVSGFGDYANVIGQTFAVRGLHAAGSAAARPALRFLIRQQCEAGYFRLNFTPDPTAADQTCDGGKWRTTSAPDTDVTALAVLSLQTLHPQTRPVRRSLRDATAWLKRHQRVDGSFGGGTSTEGSNANSTGLAAWALGTRGACRAAVPAATWVHGLQVDAVRAGSPLATERGAIAYDRAAYARGVRQGIRTATRDQWRRTTAQAAPALGYLTRRECRAR